MTKTILAPLFALSILPACLSEVDLGESESALTPAIAPISTFEIRADRVVYIGYDGSGYRAYELDETLAVLRKSPAISTLSAIENLTTDGTNVLFGDGSRNVRLSLAGSATQTFDPYGVFGKGLRGNGGVTLRDGTLTRSINGNGFGLSWWSPSEVYSGAQPTAVPVLSQGARAYVTPMTNYLRLVDVDKGTSMLICKTGAAYATTKSLATAHDQPTGTVRVVAKLTDGRLADCTRSATSASVKIIELPFEVGDVAVDGGGGVGFDGGGGVGVDGGGGVGIWATSASTSELAYIFPSGKIVIYPLSAKTSITPIPIPRVVRSFSDGSALVLMSNQQFLRVARP